MAIVYRHIRLDKNEPFYIGIGVDEKRAHNTYSRSKWWKNIVDKTDYEVQILFDDLTWDEACEKEKEFITLYGRKDLGTGTLVNLTGGGDGTYGRDCSEISKKISETKKKNPFIYTDEVREKMRQSQLGKKISDETRKKLSLSGIGNTNGFKKGVKQSQESIEKRFNKIKKPVYKLSLDGEILEEYASKKEAEIKNNVHLNSVLSGKGKTAGGYKWEYKNNK